MLNLCSNVIYHLIPNRVPNRIFNLVPRVIFFITRNLRSFWKSIYYPISSLI
jgi:hypothetical protein